MSERETNTKKRNAGVAIVLLLAALVLIKDLLTFLVVGDHERDWQLGTEPNIPAETYQSTEPPTAAADAPPQVTLPERP